MVRKLLLNFSPLIGLLIDMKLADPSHQSGRRMQGLIEQPGGVTDAAPIHREQRPRRGISSQGTCFHDGRIPFDLTDPREHLRTARAWQ